MPTNSFSYLLNDITSNTSHFIIQPLRPAIKKVIFNNPATIVMWSDNTKTVVKADNEPFDEEKGLAMAISKRFLGNKGNYFNEFKKWLPQIEGRVER